MKSEALYRTLLPMSRLSAKVYCAVIILAGVCLSGCFPGNESHVDEEKDPHFLSGRSLVASQDYKKAVDEYEQAVEANPRSASAHLELGWLYDEKIKDYPAAIYHYQKHLALRPDSDRLTEIKDRIRGCKRAIAETELLPNSQGLQQKLAKLSEENALLKQQLEAFHMQPAAAAAAPAAPVVVPARLEAPHVAQTAAVAATPAPAATPPPAPAKPRVHIVKERETLSSIAAQYSIKVSALMAANPKVDPKRMRPGQSLNLP